MFRKPKINPSNNDTLFFEVLRRSGSNFKEFKNTLYKSFPSNQINSPALLKKAIEALIRTLKDAATTPTKKNRQEDQHTKAINNLNLIQQQIDQMPDMNINTLLGTIYSLGNIVTNEFDRSQNLNDVRKLEAGSEKIQNKLKRLTAAELIPINTKLERLIDKLYKKITLSKQRVELGAEKTRNNKI